MWKLINFGKIIHHLDPEIKKLLLRGSYGKKISIFDSGPFFILHLNLNSFSNTDNGIEFKFQRWVNHRPESNMEFLLPCRPLNHYFPNLWVDLLRWVLVITTTHPPLAHTSMSEGWVGGSDY